MTKLTHYAAIAAFQTKDGSEIRELMHPSRHGNRAQSLAEARIRPGEQTALHRHIRSEELYHVMAGEGVMTLDGEQFTIRPGDSIAISPGTSHRVRNTGSETLVILCCCSPPYTHDDTVLL